jgi:hypothetical protein
MATSPDEARDLGARVHWHDRVVRTEARAGGAVYG